MKDPETISNFLNATNMFFAGLAFVAVWIFKIIFGRMKELHERSITDDKRIEAKIDETADQRRSVDRDLYQQQLIARVKIAKQEGIQIGYRRGLEDGLRQGKLSGYIVGSRAGRKTDGK